MSDWTAGYVADIDYTHGYYRELSPPMLSLAVLNRAVATRARRPFRYLELGFGQGLSLNIHAAACAGEFWGTDFNPAQAANARELAEAAGSGARIFDLSFAEFAARDDSPEFDVIALHGIWSWISAENRAVIVELVRRKLAVGGALYISYNCTPGWSPAMPLRHLMMLHAELAGSEAKGITGRVNDAIAFAQQVVDSGALYFRGNPAVAERLKKIAGQNRHYLAHEYFNRDWDPMPFSQVAELFGGAKVDFAASAHMLDHVDAVNLTAEAQKLLAGIGHPVLRDSVRDYMVSQQFRRDVFIKGARPMSPLEQLERYRALGFVLLSHPDDISMKLQGPAGEVSLQEGVYKPLINALAEHNFASKTVAELAAHPANQGRPLPQLIQALIILTGAGHVQPVQDAETVKLAKPRCKALNTHLFNRARFSGDVAFLASPVIGGGVGVARFHQLFLLARQAGRPQPEAWAQFAWEIINGQGQRIIKEGKTLETPEGNLAELQAQAKEFAVKRLPILQALGVAA